MRTATTFIAILLLAVAPWDGHAQTTRTVSGMFDYEQAKALVKAVNIARLKNGGPTMKLECDLTEAAMLRAAELYTQWEGHNDISTPMEDHTRPNGKSFQTIMAAKYPEQTCGEYGELYVCTYNTPRMRKEIKNIFCDERMLTNASAYPWGAAGVGVFHSEGRIICVFLLVSKGNGVSGVAPGLFNVDVQVGTASGKGTSVLKRTETTDKPKVTTSVQTEGTFRYDFASEVVALVNERRREAGVAPLAMDSTITEYAMLRSAELESCIVMPTSFFYKSTLSMKGISLPHLYGHIRAYGDDALTIFPVMPSACGENLAANQQTPEEVVEGWMNSPGHRANILKSAYKSIGVGCYVRDKNVLWIQLFSSNPAKAPYRPTQQEEVTVQVSHNRDVETKVLKRKRLSSR